MPERRGEGKRGGSGTSAHLDVLLQLFLVFLLQLLALLLVLMQQDLMLQLLLLLQGGQLLL